MQNTKEKKSGVTSQQQAPAGLTTCPCLCNSSQCHFGFKVTCCGSARTGCSEAKEVNGFLIRVSSLGILFFLLQLLCLVLLVCKSTGQFELLSGCTSFCFLSVSLLLFFCLPCDFEP